MAYLVTGGAGFIGSALVHALCARGETVRVLDDLSTGVASNLDGTSAELVVGSAVDRSLVESCLADVTSIAHLAALGSVPRSVADPIGSHVAGVDGTLAVLEAARTSGAQVVLSSSSSVYGANTSLPKREEMWTQPLSPYGAAKLAAESYCLAYGEVYGLDVLVLRLFNVYGPRQSADHDYAAVVPRFSRAALRGEPLMVHGDGKQTRDFTHVDSVVRVLADAMGRRVSHQRPVNLGFGDRVSVRGVVEEIGRQLDRSLDVCHVGARRGDMVDTQSDPALLLSMFPNSAHPVPLSEGIASVLDWMGAAGR